MTGILAAAVVAAALATMAWIAAGWPDVASLARQNPATTSFIESDRQRGVEVQWRWVPYDHISDHLKLAVVVAEDISFFDHRGFDTREMANAIRDAVNGRRLRGASTITQQLAKNLWLTASRSPLRKLREGILTWQLERSLSKRRILELYLNVVEFGPGIYGAKAAARRYFGCEPSDLDADQSAQLAAALSRPSLWHPGSPARGYDRQVRRIRSRMSRAGWLERLVGAGGPEPAR